MVKLNKVLIAGALVAVTAVPVVTEAQRSSQGRVVMVAIHRVAQIDNLDKFDVDPDRADFYATVWIGGNKPQKSKNFSEDDGKPEWTFSGTTNGRYVPVRIKLNDDDGGLEEKDDYVDICRKSKKKDLHLRYDTQTGRITGDVSGRRGQILYSQGDGDSDKGKIWFSIR